MDKANQNDLRHVCLVGSFPPPVTGMTSVNAAMKQYFAGAEIDFTAIDLSPGILNRSWVVRLFRLIKIIKGIKLYLIFLFGTRGKNTTLYLCVSGGFGQVYELLFICLSRLFSRKIILHHHCSSYLIKPRFITKILTIVAGTQAVHIVLCGSMGSRLKENYRAVNDIFVLSNATLIENFSLTPVTISSKNQLQTIGFIGNISVEKGIFEVFEVAEQLQKDGVDVRVVVAGPFSDSNLKYLFFKKQTVLNNINYVGAKYGKEKSSFYNSIDVLLFPTKYVNEAEPLTIHEAMAHGVPVIAWGRGCIPHQIPENTGFVVNINENFVENAVAKIKLWKYDQAAFTKISEQAGNQYIQIKNKYLPNLEKLLLRL